MANSIEARLSWGRGVLMLIAACVLAIATALYVLGRRSGYGAQFTTLLLALLCGAIVSAVMWEEYAVPAMREAIEAFRSRENASSILVVTNVLNGLAFVAAFALARAAGSTLEARVSTAGTGASAKFTAGELIERAKDVGQRMRYASVLLYVNVAVLLASIDEIVSFYKLPRVLYPSATDAMAVDRIAAAVGTSYGIAYTIYLMSVFLPVMLLLKSQEYAIVASAEQQTPPMAIDMSKYSPWTTVPRQLGQVVALLTPLIGSQMISLLTSLMSQ